MRMKPFSSDVFGWCASTADQLADVLTKKLPALHHRACISGI
jgi:hypothetical protein